MQFRIAGQGYPWTTRISGRSGSEQGEAIYQGMRFGGVHPRRDEIERFAVIIAETTFSPDELCEFGLKPEGGARTRLPVPEGGRSILFLRGARLTHRS